MDRRLSCGQYFGAVLKRAEFGPILMTETRHSPNSFLPTHAHKTAYFCFVRQGQYREIYENRTRDCRPLTVAFHPPEEAHSERIADVEVRSLNVEVSDPWLARVQEVAPRLREPIDAQGGAPAWLGARLYREFMQPDRASPLAVEGLLLEAAAELTRATDRSQGAPPWLQRIRTFLCDRFRDQPTLSDLGREAGVHPIYLTSAFRKRFGCSIGEFIRARRVEHAALLLSQRKHTLAEVAAQSGFSDQSHLTRLFKRATGLTPAEYRAQA